MVILMDIDEYFQCVRRFAKRCVNESLSPQDLIEGAGLNDQNIRACIEIRSSLINAQEQCNLSGYLEIGFFALAKNKSERLAAFAFCFDIQHAVDLLSLQRQCEEYHKDHDLFRGVPKLFSEIRRKPGTKNPDFELIALKAAQSYNGTEIYNVKEGYVKLTHLLNPGIVNWASWSFPNSPIYVRFDPHFFSKEIPRQYLTEATLVPANPKWLAGFNLRKGMKDFASYVLEDVSVKDDQQQFWDYRFKDIRRLEVRVERRKDDYLTMMIEELPKEDDLNGLMLGYCIHLDTRDPVGTPLKEVSLNHLDLAINVYEGSRRQERFSQSLQDGKVVDASFRTHLLRIEKASFESVFDFCRIFLRSQFLLEEWIQDVIGAGTGDALD